MFLTSRLTKHNIFPRGPKGVWTLEKKGLKPDINISFDDAKPTYTHMALIALQKAGKTI